MLILLCVLGAITIAGCFLTRRFWRWTPCNLFVFSGPPGAGKSTALGILASLAGVYDLVVFQKDTTRSPRAAESVLGCRDSVFVSREVFAERCRRPGYLPYRVKETLCGVDVPALQALCSRHRNVCCTITDGAITDDLPKLLKGVRVIVIGFYADACIIDDRLDRVASRCENEERIGRTDAMQRSYRLNPFRFTHTILNVFDESTFERHLHQLVRRYNPSVDPCRETRSDPQEFAL